MILTMSEQFLIMRRRRGLSIGQLSAKSGISRNTITKIEAGEVMNVRLATLNAIASALDYQIKIVEEK